MYSSEELTNEAKHLLRQAQDQHPKGCCVARKPFWGILPTSTGRTLLVVKYAYRASKESADWQFHEATMVLG